MPITWNIAEQARILVDAVHGVIIESRCASNDVLHIAVIRVRDRYLESDDYLDHERELLKQVEAFLVRCAKRNNDLQVM